MYCRLIAALMLSLLCGACSSLVSLAPEARPRPEPITAAGNKSPYTVFGQTYHVMTNARAYKESGTASWYGPGFHGRKTSNGERYNMYTVSAAHKTLPIPSYVRVTNLDNKRELIVRINDRGPFHDNRIIDLSYAAAVKLGFAQQGTARVTVEFIDTGIVPTGMPSQSHDRLAGDVPNVPAPIVVAPSVSPEIAASKEPTRYLQVGLFSDAAAAQSFAKQLSENVELPIKVDSSDQIGKHIVAVGPIETDADLETARLLLLFKGVDGAFVIYGLE